MNALVRQEAFALSTEEAPCTECKGRGYFWSDAGPAPRRESCDECDGKGWNYPEVEL